MSIYAAARNRKPGRSAFGVGVVLLASFLALVRLSAASPLLRLQDASVTAVDPKAEILRLVDLIRKADYDGDRTQLQILYGKLEPFVGAKDFSASALYWRGFALWRRAINGVNDAVSGQELADDLQKAIGEFQKAQVARPGFVDARIGETGCEMLLIYADRDQNEKMQRHIARATSLVADVRSVAPDNPRFLWLLGGAYWSSPTGAGGSQEKALEVYTRGVEISKRQPTASAHSLEPTWGEPELLMNLAWSSLHKTSPDPALAQTYAQAALAIVPGWHYVRDLLLPQIVEALKTSGTPNAQSVPAFHVGDKTVDGSFIQPYDNVWIYRVTLPGGRVVPQGLWSDHVQSTTVNGASALLRVQGLTMVNGKSKSTVNVFNPQTMAPIWSEAYSPDGTVFRRDFDGSHVKSKGPLPGPATSTRKDESSEFDLPSAVFDFNGGMYGLLLVAMPLRMGASGTFPTIEEGENKASVDSFKVIREEDVSAGSHGKVHTWVVESERPGQYKMTFWLTKSAPYIIRLVYTQPAKDSPVFSWDMI